MTSMTMFNLRTDLTNLEVERILT